MGARNVSERSVSARGGAGKLFGTLRLRLGCASYVLLDFLFGISYASMIYVVKFDMLSPTLTPKTAKNLNQIQKHRKNLISNK